MKISSLEDGQVFIPKNRMNNLQDLCDKLTKLESFFGKELLITSGYRSIRQHHKIYQRINDKRALEGLDPVPVPIGSKHLTGQAADVHDPLNELKTWIAGHIEIIEAIGFWCEAFKATPTWCHLQTVAPASGSRFFNP